MTGKAIVLRGNALNLPLPDESVDLIVTSPPYFALRSYQDSCPTCGGAPGQPNHNGTGASTLTGGRSKIGPATVGDKPDPDCPDCHGTGRGHYDGQIGSEPTPKDFLDALIAATAEMARVLKPSGSIWVNLGDKYAGSGPRNNENFNERWHGSSAVGKRAQEQGRPDSVMDTVKKTLSGGDPRKSLMLLPHRYAIRCVDELGLICRQDQVWSKPNGLPESVTDRTRRSHEFWFHFVKSPKYFSAIDEIREAHHDVNYPDPASYGNRQAKKNPKKQDSNGLARSFKERGGMLEYNPLGKLPGSVWTVPTEPLKVPPHLGIDHFAAFPTEWPRRLILGWSPSGVCTVCGEGRRPVVDKGKDHDHTVTMQTRGRMDSAEPNGNKRGINATEREIYRDIVQIGGYKCACWNGSNSAPGATDLRSATASPTTRQGDQYTTESRTCPPTTPAVVLDPFGGTGTTALVAKTLGRIGISVDLSADYCRLARWRCFESNHGAKALSRTNLERQGELLL